MYFFPVYAQTLASPVALTKEYACKKIPIYLSVDRITKAPVSFIPRVSIPSRYHPIHVHQSRGDLAKADQAVEQTLGEKGDKRKPWALNPNPEVYWFQSRDPATDAV